MKWLLNERAALAGRMAQLQGKLDGLQCQLAQAERRAAAVSAKLEASRRLRQELMAQHAALDAVLATSFSSVNPVAGGVVRPWAGKHGALGGLKAYVLSLLENASPAAISTGDLARITAVHFELHLDSNAERRAFRLQVRRLLRSARHLVEEIPSPNARKMLVWHWRTAAFLSGLHQEALENEAAHPLSPEVGGERAGGSDG